MFGLGNIVESVCDAIGAPEEMGDWAGMMTELACGNYLAASEHALDFGAGFAEKMGYEDLATALHAGEIAMGTVNGFKANGGKGFLEGDWKQDIQQVRQIASSLDGEAASVNGTGYDVVINAGLEAYEQYKTEEDQVNQGRTQTIYA